MIHVRFVDTVHDQPVCLSLPFISVQGIFFVPCSDRVDERDTEAERLVWGWAD